MAKKNDPLNADNPYQQPDTRQSTANIDPAKDTIIHNSPAGKNETVIYNSGTNTYRIQTNDGKNNITEKDPNGNILYSGSNDSQTRAIVAQGAVHDQQVAAEQAKAQAAYDKANPPPNVTPDQIAQIGQASQTGVSASQLLNDPITQNIQQLQQQRKTNAYTGIGALNSAIPALEALPLGLGSFASAAINTATQSEAARLWVKDYSQETNYDKIMDNVGLAKIKLALSISVANKPGDLQASQDAITSYNDAINQLNLAKIQLKMISDHDQRAYADNIKTDISKITTYMNENIYAPGTLNDKFKDSLKKPNPSSYKDPFLIDGGATNG